MPRKLKEKICLQCACTYQSSDPRVVCCSRECAVKIKRAAYVKDWLDGRINGMRGVAAISMHIRNYLLDECGRKCPRCGWGEKNPKTGLVPLTINHIDGNYQNNVRSNLEVLCPNCHSLTPNFGSLNKGMGRPQRRKKGF